MDAVITKDGNPRQGSPFALGAFPNSECGLMPGRERDPDGYSLGELLSREVAKTVETLRARRKMSLTDLHNETGIPLSHLSEMIRGRENRKTKSRGFQRRQIVALAAALGVKEADLLPSSLPPQLAAKRASTSNAEKTFSSLYAALEDWSNSGGDPVADDSEFVHGLHDLYFEHKRRAAGHASARQGARAAEKPHK